MKEGKEQFRRRDIRNCHYVTPRMSPFLRGGFLDEPLFADYLGGAATRGPNSYFHLGFEINWHGGCRGVE